MRDIGNLLLKYSRLPVPPRVIREAAAAVISQTAKIDIGPDKLDYRGGIVFLKTGSSIKNTVFIHKEKILKTIAGVLNKKTVTDIR